MIKNFKTWRPRELEPRGSRLESKSIGYQPRDICPFDSLAIVLNQALLINKLTPEMAKRGAYSNILLESKIFEKKT